MRPTPRPALALLALLAACGQTPGELAVEAPALDASDPLVLLAQLEAQGEALPAAVAAQEDALAAASASVLRPLVEALSTGAVLPAGAARVETAGFGLPVAERSMDGITEHSWSEAPFADWRAGFASVDFAALPVHAASLAGDTLSLTAHLDLRGTDVEGALRHDRAVLDLTLVLVDGVWTLTRMSAAEGETLTREGAAFVDATAEAGLGDLTVYPRVEALRRGGYGIAAGDVDNDGDPDLYLGNWGNASLLLNNGDGTYTDVTEASGLAGVDRVKAAALADLDNDGDRDLVLSRFVDDDPDDVMVFSGNGDGTFARVAGAVTKDLAYDRAMPMTVSDFDDDGFLDIYVGFPGARDFTSLAFSPDPLQTQGLFRNEGSLSFADHTLAAGLGPKDEDGNRRAWPHAAVDADFDGDGDVDLIVADDRQGPTTVLRNGGGVFENQATDLGVDNSGWAMGIATADYDGDGLTDLYISNLDLLAAKRIAPHLADASDAPFRGNRLYRNTGDGGFVDVTAEAGVAWAGEAAAGSGWFDYDNDGDLDLYVLNGLWTGAGDDDLSSTFAQAYTVELGHVRDGAGDTGGTLRNAGLHNAVLGVLTRFTGDLGDPSVAATGGPAPTLSMAGNQRNALFRNNGDGTFTEVGFLLGLDTQDDGYMPATADVDGDGDLDLFVRNCDPASEAAGFGTLRLYRNDSGADAQSVRLRLEGDGSLSNRNAFGAVVKARVGDRVMVRQLSTVNGAAQSEAVLHFGLGDASQLDEVTVYWPGGRTETLTDVDAGDHTLVEGR